MKKSLVLLGAAVPLVTLFFFWDFFLIQGLQWYLQQHAKRSLGYPIQYEKLINNPSHILVENPYIFDTVNQKKVAAADVAEITHSLDIVKRQFIVRVALKNPHIPLTKIPSLLSSIASNQQSSPILFSIPVRIVIDNGLILSKEGTPVADFSLQWKDNKALLKLQEHGLERSMTIAFSEYEGMPTYDCEMHKVSCNLLMRLLSSVNKKEMPLDIISGDIQGNLSLVSQEKRVQVTGQVDIKDFAYRSFDNYLKSYIKRMHIELQETVGVQNTIIFPSYLSPLFNSLSLKGKIDVVGGKLSLQNSNKESTLHITDITGSGTLLPVGNAWINLYGTTKKNGSDIPLLLSSSIQDLSNYPIIDMTMKVSPLDKPMTVIHCTCQKHNDALKELSITLNHFTPDSHDLLDPAIAYIFGSTPIAFREGVIDASAKISVEKGTPTSLEIRHLLTKNIHIDISAIPLQLRCDHLQGAMALNFGHSNPLETLDIYAHIMQGSIIAGDVSSSHTQLSPFLKLDNINGEMSLKDGTVDKSTFLATYGGLKGTIDIGEKHSKLSSKLFTLTFSGIVSDLFLPNRTQGVNASLDELASAPLILQLKGYKEQKHTKFQATAQIDQHTIHLGWSLVRGGNTSKPMEDSSLDLSSKDRQIIEDWDRQLTSVETTTHPTSTLQNLLQKHDLHIEDGWLKFEEMPLSKIWPLLNEQDDIFIEGVALVKGSFDSRRALLQCSLEHLRLETLNTSISCDDRPQNVLLYYDFSKKKCFGGMPLISFKYIDRVLNLQFSEISGYMLLKDSKLYVDRLEAYYRGAFFGASAVITPHSFTAVDVNMRIDEIKGKVSQLYPLMTTIEPHLLLWRMPFEGDISLKENASHISFSKTKNNTTLEAHIAGLLSDGSYLSPHSHMAFHDISCNFDYHHKDKELSLVNLQGTLLVGKPNNVDEYTLFGDHIRFKGERCRLNSFDMWIGDHNHDIVRLVGTAQPIQDDPNSIAVTLNPQLSHIGDVHPSLFHLKINENNDIADFHWKSLFKLPTLVQSLQRFSKTGLFFFSYQLLSMLDQVKETSGEISLELGYKGALTPFSFTAQGKNILVNGHIVHDFFLQGNRQDKIWTLDQLRIDKMSLSAELIRKEKECRVNFLGIRYGDSLLAGFQGIFSPSTNHFKGRIDLLDIDLAHTNEFLDLPASLQRWKPKGFLRGDGNLEISFIKESNRWQVDADMNMQARSVELLGTSLRDIKNISCRYISDKGLCLENIHTSLQKKESSETFAELSLQAFSYRIPSKEINVEQLQFSIHRDHLDNLLQRFEKPLADSIGMPLATYLKQIKKKGNIDGTVNLHSSRRNFFLNIALSNDEYLFGNESYSLRSCELNATSQRCAFSTMIDRGDDTYSLAVHLDPFSYHKGEISLTHLPKEKRLTTQPLTIQWYKDRLGLHISKAVGTFEDLYIDIGERGSGKHPELAGVLRGPIVKMASLAKLPYEIFSENHTEGIIALNGSWGYDKEQKDYCFQGILSGEKGHWKGIVWDNIEAKVNYTPGLLKVEEVVTKGSKGAVTVKSIGFKNENDLWNFNIASLHGKDVQLTLFESSSHSQEKTDTFVLKQFNINNISGIWGQEITYQGNGKVNFIYLPQKNSKMFSTAIDNAAQHVGLDTNMITPVMGNIGYEISQGKIYIKELKDVYSAGKRSRFSLAGPAQSYIGFDKTLHMHLSLKPYNLVAKMATLLTFSVTGTLDDPAITLQKTHK